MKRNNQIVIFVTEGEKARMKYLADFKGLSVSALVRYLVSASIVRDGLWEHEEVKAAVLMDREGAGAVGA